jgi:hypothetical protein
VWLSENGVTQNNFLEALDSSCAVWGLNEGCILLC